MPGLITHRLRPVYYSPSSRTALAEAELRYEDGYKSRSVYVAFPVEDMPDALKKVVAGLGIQDLQLAIWTTTPWTLPANMVSCVRLHADERESRFQMISHIPLSNTDANILS